MVLLTTLLGGSGSIGEGDLPKIDDTLAITIGGVFVALDSLAMVVKFEGSLLNKELSAFVLECDKVDVFSPMEKEKYVIEKHYVFEKQVKK